MIDDMGLDFAARVHVLLSPDGEATGRQVPLPGPGVPLEVGRAPGRGGLAVADSKLSRRHIRITDSLEGALRIEDMGSRNGTFVDRVALVGAMDVWGDAVLRIGHTILHAGRSLPDEASPVSALDPLIRALARRMAGGTGCFGLYASPGSGVRTLVREVHKRSGRTGALTLLSAGWRPESACAALAGGEGATVLLPGAESAGTEVVLDLCSGAAGADALLVLSASPGSGVLERVIDPARISRLPPVRGRRAAVWGLTRAWLRERFGDGGPELSRGAANVWLNADMPDGWRTLRDRFERLSAQVAHRTVVRSEDVRAIMDTAPAASRDGREMGRPSQQELEEALRLLPTVTAVAEHFGRPRRQVYRWMDFYGIERPSAK